MRLYRSETLRLVVWGREGLFQRPEFRADPVTYPIIPPPAAQGIVGTVCIHPAADIQNGERSAVRVDISAIKVLAPIQYMSQKVADRQSLPIHDRACSSDTRLTHLVLLKDPKFMIEFEYVSPISAHHVIKYAVMFKERIKKGRSFKEAGMGRRRYLAHVRSPEPADAPISAYDVLGQFPWGTEYASEGNVLHTFPALLDNGTLRVPSFWQHIWDLRGTW